MSEWPPGWTRDDRRRERPRRDDPTVVLPDHAYPPRPASPGVPPAGTPGRLRAPRRRRWPRRVAFVLVVILVLLVGGYFYLDSRLHRVAALGDYAGRPAATPGQDWLIVGSDSRAGLTRADRAHYRTGDAAGQRTDTIMLLHIPASGGGPTLVSLPRDSYVPIPGQGRNKLNAAFAIGGPALLVRTVESVTGIRIDHFAQVGFGGFVGIVDAVGGVHICVERPMNDPKAGIDLKPGCQDLTGGQALGYVRSRASARGDLDRVQHQRKLLAALVAKATSPGVLLNPFRSVPLALNSADTLDVDNGDHLYSLLRLAWVMRAVSGGGAVTTTVPIAGFASTPEAGSVVLWDRAKALELFDALRADRQVPPDARSG